jgi:hypothetical protein
MSFSHPSQDSWLTPLLAKEIKERKSIQIYLTKVFLNTAAFRNEDPKKSGNCVFNGQPCRRLIGG